MPPTGTAGTAQVSVVPSSLAPAGSATSVASSRTSARSSVTTAPVSVLVPWLVTVSV